MKTEVYFSIIMPVYDSKDTLAKAIQSILNQSYDNYELIIVDDHSTDGSYQIEKKSVSKNKKIRLYRMKENRGAPYCMNFGTREAKYEWIANVDSDHVAPRDWLEIANRYTQENLDLFGGKYVYLPNTYKNGYFMRIFYYSERLLCPNKDIPYNKKNFGEPLLAGGNFFYKKRLFEDLEGFDTTIRAGYDILFFSLAVERGFSVKYFPKLFVYHPLYNYRSLKTFLRRVVHFNENRTLIIKKSKLVARQYRLIPIIFVSLLIYFLSFCLLFGLMTTIVSTLIIGFWVISMYSLKLLLKDKIPVKYIAGYVFLDFIKKSIASTIYLLKVKPKRLDWKCRKIASDTNKE